jgi:PTS system nitrogen regulatory IIA component
VKLASILSEKFIIIGARVSSIEEAIDLLVHTIADKYSFRESRENVIKAVLEREAQGGTVFPTGIAIPHARLEEFNDVVVGICIPEKPIIVDEIPVKMVALVVTSKTTPKLYLNVLAALLQISQDEKVFNEIISAEDPDRIIEIIGKYGIQIKKELIVADIMEKDYPTVAPKSTLKEVIDIFIGKRILCCPVVDNGKLVGEISVIEIIKTGLPKYITLLENLSFLKTIEPFEDLLKNEDKIKVSSVMRKAEITMKPDSSIIELAFEIVQNRVSCFPVVENGNKYLGVVTVGDILAKILRG